MADDYGYEQGEFEQKPKVVKDFAKAYMQVRILIILALGIDPYCLDGGRHGQQGSPRRRRKPVVGYRRGDEGIGTIGR